MIRSRLGASARGTPRVPPSSLPAVQAAEEGYILQVQGGTWVVVQPMQQLQQRLLASNILVGINATIDFNVAARAFLDLDVSIPGTLTLVIPTLPPNYVQHVTLEVRQGTGGQTINAYSANIIWPGGGAAPVLSTGAGEVDMFSGIAEQADNLIRMVASLQFPS